MIDYTNYSDTHINISLYGILNAEFKPVRIVFRDDFNEADFQGNNQYVKIWCQDSRWISNCTNGETREYEYSINYYIRDLKHVDRISLAKSYSNFGERLNQILNHSRYYVSDGIYRWHQLTIDGSNSPVAVDDKDGEEISGLKVIEKTVNIVRQNNWADAQVEYDPALYDVARFG